MSLDCSDVVLVFPLDLQLIILEYCAFTGTCIRRFNGIQWTSMLITPAYIVTGTAGGLTIVWDHYMNILRYYRCGNTSVTRIITLNHTIISETAFGLTAWDYQQWGEHVVIDQCHSKLLTPFSEQWIISTCTHQSLNKRWSQIRILDINTHTQVVESMYPCVVGCVVKIDATRVGVGLDNGQVIMWNVSTNKKIILGVNKHPVSHLLVYNSMVMAACGNYIRVWDVKVRKWYKPWSYKLEHPGVSGMHMLNTDLISYSAHNVCIWDVSTSANTHKRAFANKTHENSIIRCHIVIPETIMTCFIHHNTIIIGMDTGVIRFYDREGTVKMELNAHTQPARLIGMTDDDKLITTHHGHSLKVWV